MSANDIVSSPVVKSPIRLPLPADLVKPMRLFRLGLDGLPTGYIVWHEELAQAEARRLVETYGLIICACLSVPTWDFDGMRVIELVVETVSGRLLKLKWNVDTHGFAVDTGHGHAAMFASDLA